MKRSILAALVAFFVFSTPVAALAQDDGDAAKDPVTTAVVAVEEPTPAPDNFQDFGLWIFAIFATLSMAGGAVSLAVIEKGIKPIVTGILNQFPGDDALNKAIRTVIIHAGVFVAAYYVVVNRGINLFNSAPSQVLDMVPSHNFQLGVTVILLALSVFGTYSVKKWFAPDEPAPTLAS